MQDEDDGGPPPGTTIHPPIAPGSSLPAPPPLGRRKERPPAVQQHAFSLTWLYKLQGVKEPSKDRKPSTKAEQRQRNEQAVIQYLVQSLLDVAEDFMKKKNSGGVSSSASNSGNSSTSGGGSFPASMVDAYLKGTLYSLSQFLYRDFKTVTTVVDASFNSRTLEAAMPGFSRDVAGEDAGRLLGAAALEVESGDHLHSSGETNNKIEYFTVLQFLWRLILWHIRFYQSAGAGAGGKNSNIVGDSSEYGDLTSWLPLNRSSALLSEAPKGGGPSRQPNLAKSGLDNVNYFADSVDAPSKAPPPWLESAFTCAQLLLAKATHLSDVCGRLFDVLSPML